MYLLKACDQRKIGISLINLMLLWQSCGSVRTGTDHFVLPGATCSRPSRGVLSAHLAAAGNPSGRGCANLQADGEHFVIVYDKLILTCGQLIKIYYQPSDTEDPERVIDCHTKLTDRLVADITTHQELLVVFENPNHSSNYNISIMATSFIEDAECSGDNNYLCFYDDRSLCVNSSALCDGHVNCPDGEDEGDGCAERRLEDDEAGDLHKLASGIVAVILVGAILVCVACVVAIVCCVRQYQQRDREGPLLQHMSDTSETQPTLITEEESFYPSGPQTSHGGGYQAVPQGGFDQGQQTFGYDSAPTGRYESLPRLPSVPEDVTGSSVGADDEHLPLSGPLSPTDVQRVDYSASASAVKVPL